MKLTCLFKILSDETRLRILIALYHRELCVCEIQRLLNECQPKVSKHLGKLRDMGFVRDERKEQFIYYYLKENEMLKGILKSIIENSNEYEKLKDDVINMKNTMDCGEK